MKQIFLITTFFLALTNYTNSQEIKVKKTFFGGYEYTQSDKNLMLKDLELIMKSNTKTFELTKKARSNKTWSWISGIPGGFLFGYSLGGDKVDWKLTGIGASLVTISFHLESKSNKKLKEAIQLYNASLNSTSLYEFQPEFNIIGNRNGIGISMIF